MFDKLVESDTTGAEFKNRSRYFMVSSVVVGILFLTAVVYSLYAADIGLGSGNFDIADLLAPVETDAPEERPQPANPERSTASDRQTVRPVLMEETQSSTRIPTGVSADRNLVRTLSADRFENVSVGPVASDGIGNLAVGPSCRVDCSGTGSRSAVEPAETEIAEIKPPPPVVKSKPVLIKTSKVLNGSALSLPKPAYPQPAVVLNLQGSVRVQVTIDETGRVISAKAADGHPFFRQAAENAARNAKFNPTYLNDNAVKVTGVIVYNFRRN
jgi:TonB family protein